MMDDPDASMNDEPDAGEQMQTHSGEILFFETEFLQFPEFGSGALFRQIFQANEDVVAPSYEESPGSPFACKVWEYTPEEFLNPGTNEGTLELSVANSPEIPPCNFVPNQGYRCIGAMGTGGDIAPVPEMNNPDGDLFMLTDTAITFGDDEVGRHVNISGATTPTNNGLFPVVMAMGDNTIIYINPNGAEEAATEAQYATVAGFGPAGLEDPYPDEGNLEVSLTAGGDENVGDFSTSIGIGDSFTLDTASQTLLTDGIPMDGSEFTVSCDGEGGDCGGALASVVNITTTDGDPAGLPPFALPPPESKVVQVVCIVLSGSVTVPAEASQYLADSGATRVRTLFVRAENTEAMTDTASVTLAAGHAKAAFQTIGGQ